MRYTYSIALLLCLVSIPLSAATIQVFGTGLDASGQFLSAGAMDPHYTLTVNDLGTGPNTFVAKGASATESLSQGVPPNWPDTPGTWATDPMAQWIAPQADVVGIPGVGTNTFYTYQTTFDLTGFSLSGVQLNGHFTADNYISQVSLNGVPFYTGGGCVTGGNFTFENLTPFSLSSGFNPGVNTLSFNVTNDVCANSGGGAPNPSGLLVDVSGSAAAAIPEPVTMFPVAAVLAFAAFQYRRRYLRRT